MLECKVFFLFLFFIWQTHQSSTIVQIGLLNIDVHCWQDWRTLVRVTTHTRNVIYAETCPINYTVAMGLLHGVILAAWCVCRTPRLCRDMHPWPRTVFMIIWLITTSIASTQTSGHKPRKSEFRKLGGMEREPSSSYTWLGWLWVTLGSL